MDKKNISSRLLQYIMNLNHGDLSIKISSQDKEQYVSFFIKYSSISDKELAKELIDCSSNLINYFMWWDREIVGNAVITNNISDFLPVFREIVDNNYDSIIGGEHVRFGFGSNSKGMMFRFHPNLLYNVIMNSVTAC